MNARSIKWLVMAAASFLLASAAFSAKAQSTADDGFNDVPAGGIGIADGSTFMGPRQVNLLPDTEIFQFDTQDTFYDKRRYSDDFRMKGIEISPNIYFGEAKIAGEKGPGFVIEKGDWFWGFNHQGAEILLKF